jgi:uncharacterized damage-inducible protein DinB
MNNLLISSVKELLLRDITKLRQEISSYKTEETIWKLDGELKNTAGNLCLHLCGNLQHYIGAVLGQSGYKRNRDAEFSTRGLSKTALLKEIDATLNIVSTTLANLNPTLLDQQYPEDVFGKPMTTGYFLIHLAGHLNYHLGQINYHRRLIDIPRQ